MEFFGHLYTPTQHYNCRKYSFRLWKHINRFNGYYVYRSSSAVLMYWAHQTSMLAVWEVTKAHFCCLLFQILWVLLNTVIFTLTYHKYLRPQYYYVHTMLGVSESFSPFGKILVLYLNNKYNISNSKPG